MNKHSNEELMKKFLDSIPAEYRDLLKPKPLINFDSIANRMMENPMPFKHQKPQPTSKKYKFSSSLLNVNSSDKITRVDMCGWENCATFILNVCNDFSLPRTENEDVNSILKKGFLETAVFKLHTQEINSLVFERIIIENKPLFSFSVNPILQLRKNVLFLIMYIKNVQEKFKNDELNTEMLGNLWLRYLLNHQNFSHLKVCTFFNKEFNKKIDKNKISTIKHFNEIVLGEFEETFQDEQLDFGWLKSIAETYNKIFGKEYKESFPIQVTTFPFFSINELEMIVFILQFNITTNENFPNIFQELVFDRLFEEGFDPQIVEGLEKELAGLAT